MTSTLTVSFPAWFTDLVTVTEEIRFGCRFDDRVRSSYDFFWRIPNPEDVLLQLFFLTYFPFRLKQFQFIDFLRTVRLFQTHCHSFQELNLYWNKISFPQLFFSLRSQAAQYGGSGMSRNPIVINITTTAGALSWSKRILYRTVFLL